MTDPAPSIRRNATILMVGNAVSLVAPLIVVPYLARVLGPEGWAPVLLAQGVAAWLVVIMEFGFELSGTRALAQAGTDHRRRGTIVQGVQSARLVLAPVAALALVAAFGLTDDLRGERSLLAWTLVHVMLRGFTPLWYFQGIERVGMAVAVDVAARLAAALAVFAVVHGPADAARVLALQAAASLASTLLLSSAMYRAVPALPPSVARARESLRGGLALFSFRATASGVAALSLLVVSAVSSPMVVAVFGGAERIVRAGIGLMQPLTQALLPRISALRATSEGDATRMLRRSLRVTGGLGALVGATALLGAPALVSLLLGPGYDASVSVLRWLSPLAPLIAVNTVLGLHWAVPFGHDRAFLAAVTSAAVIQLALIGPLTAGAGAHGAALSLLVGEVVVCAGLIRARHRATL